MKLDFLTFLLSIPQQCYLHEPVEALALHLLLHLEQIADIAHVDKPGQRLPGVEVLLVLVIKPGLDDALVVAEGGGLAAKLVGEGAAVAGGAGVAAVHVAHAGAGHPHRLAAAHPHLHKYICVVLKANYRKTGTVEEANFGHISQKNKL